MAVCEAQMAFNELHNRGNYGRTTKSVYAIVNGKPEHPTNCDIDSLLGRAPNPSPPHPPFKLAHFYTLMIIGTENLDGP